MNIWRKELKVGGKEYDFEEALIPTVSHLVTTLLILKAGIGVGKYEYRTLRQGYPPRFWRKAAAAANELSNWLKHNPLAPHEDRLAHARRVVNINRLLHRSLRSG